MAAVATQAPSKKAMRVKMLWKADEPHHVIKFKVPKKWRAGEVLRHQIYRWYDPEYDIRDRTRLLRSIFEADDSTMLRKAGVAAITAVKPAPQIARTSAQTGGDVDEDRFVWGSLSYQVGHTAFGYESLSEWPQQQPDASVREPQEDSSKAGKRAESDSSDSEDSSDVSSNVSSDSEDSDSDSDDDSDSSGSSASSTISSASSQIIYIFFKKIATVQVDAK